MLSTYKLPLMFAADLLKADLEQIAASDWKAHFNKGYYEGEWKALALQSTSGRSTQLSRVPDDLGPVKDTPLLARCPYFQEVLAAFECPLVFARLLSLSPGSKILEHQDYYLGLEDSVVRIHVPITTDPRVEFYLDNQRLSLLAGETWYIDFTLPHRISNYSDTDRVHLVIDCVVNDWIKAMIPFDDEVQSQV